MWEKKLLPDAGRNHLWLFYHHYHYHYYYHSVIIIVIIFIHIIYITCHLITDNSSGTERESLEKEIELGISLGGDKHPNIVNFLGHVSNFGKKIIVKSLPLERCLILNDPMDLG